MRQSLNKPSENGFTLIELSVVLVVIGLIIGGVLTGQQIIQNARITSAINAMQSYQGQIQVYSQNYGALPGDDNKAGTRFPDGKAYADGQGNGSIGTANSFDTESTAPPAGESRLVWSHLRAAGLVKNQVGDTENAIQPPNPFNGIYGIQNGAFSGDYAMSGTVLCLNNVPADAAQTIDTRLDDGQHSSGSIRATTGAIDAELAPAQAADSSGYSGGSVYKLCMRM